MTTKVRNRKTSESDRSIIIALLATEEITQARIAELFKISQARVSQIKHQAQLLGVV
jgi:DNA-directed RNA polymerase specialized sigma subunit